MKRTVSLIRVYIVYWLKNTNKYRFLTGIVDEEELQLVLGDPEHRGSLGLPRPVRHSDHEPPLLGRGGNLYCYTFSKILLDGSHISD